MACDRLLLQARYIQRKHLIIRLFRRNRRLVIVVFVVRNRETATYELLAVEWLIRDSVSVVEVTVTVREFLTTTLSESHQKVEDDIPSTVIRPWQGQIKRRRMRVE